MNGPHTSTTPTPARIVLADDHEMVRHGLRVLLEAHPGWEVVGEAANGREAIELVRRERPDVVVLDITMPELNGFEATRRILEFAPQTEVLILTMHDSEEVVREVLAAGARGYLLKSDAAEDLASAVQALCQHRPFLTTHVSRMVLEGYLHGPGPREPGESRRERLTPRQREIVQLLAEGKSNKQVATHLGVSPKTVEAHRANIMRTLNLHSVTELVRFAVRNRMVEP